MRIAIALIAGLLAAACSGIEFKPGEVSHARREVPPGPGLLSGSDGEFVVIRQSGDPVGDGLVTEENGSEEPSGP